MYFRSQSEYNHGLNGYREVVFFLQQTLPFCFGGVQVFPKPTTQPGDRLRICLVLYSTLLRQPLVAVVSAPVEISGPKIKLIPAQVGAHINHSNNGGPLPRVGIGGAIKVAVTTGTCPPQLK